MSDHEAETTDPVDLPSEIRSFGQLAIDPLFGRYFSARLAGAAGLWTHNIVAALLAYHLTSSALAVGLVSAFQFAPELLFGLISGSFADRRDRRKQVILGQVLAATGSGTLAVWIAFVGADGLPGVWTVYAGSFVLGLGTAIAGPAGNALLPSLVSRREIGQAIALDNVPFTLARAAGPIVGVYLATSAGFAWAFAFACVGNATFAFLVHLLPVSGRSDLVQSGVDRSVREGIRYLRGNSALIRLLVGVAAVGLGSDPAITLAPPLSDALGHGSDLVGVFASAFGVGAASTFLVLQAAHRRFHLAAVSSFGFALIATGLAMLAATPVAAVAVVGFVVAGSGMTFALTSLTTQVQQRLPDHLRGRIIAMWGLAFLGSRPLSASMDGAIADVVNTRAALVVNASFVVAAAWASRRSRVESA